MLAPKKIEQKGMTFDHDFGYSYPLFTSLLKNREKKKRKMNSKKRDQKSCLSVRKNREKKKWRMNSKNRDQKSTFLLDPLKTTNSSGK